MTSPSTQPVVAGGQAAAGPGAQPGAAGTGSKRGEAPGFDAGPRWMMAIPPLVTFVIMLWGITGASYWRDEAATLSAAQRPLGNLLQTLGNIDAVHGAYYLLIWVMVQLGGTGELVTRLPSAVAMAGAAAAVAAMGRRLISPRAGLASGLVFAVLPEVSLYGQDARPYAIVVALAALASYLLVRAMPDDGRPAPLAHRLRRVPGRPGHRGHLRPAADPGARGDRGAALPARARRGRRAGTRGRWRRAGSPPPWPAPRWPARCWCSATCSGGRCPG